MRRALTLAAALAIAAAPLLVRAQPGPSHPDSATQPLLDGCRRSTGETLAGTTPEWAYVNSDRSPRRVTGPVSNTGVSTEDNPVPHTSYDYNFDVRPAPGQEDLLSTANLMSGTIHLEWEENALPFWAWPNDGDTVDAIGSWVWDCGHWGSPQDPRDDPNAWIPYAEARGVLGEQTEIHPPRALFITRVNGAAAAGMGSVADLYISSDGTPARMQAECGLSIGFDPASGAVSSDSVAERATGVAGGCSSWQPVNDRDYDFTMPAPPGDGPISVNVEEKVRTNAPAPVVTVGDGVVHVHLPFNGYGGPLATVQRPPMMLGAHISVTRPGTPVDRVTMTLKDILINSDLDTEDTTSQGITGEPSEYNVYADLGGMWVPLHSFAPDLLKARKGMRISLSSLQVHVLVPHDAETSSVRVRFMGRECDLPKMDPCATTAELGFNEDPGYISFPASEGPFALTSSGGSAGCGCYTIEGTISREAV